MIVLQISKYPDVARKGPVLQDDWFSFSHVGRERGGSVLTREEFLIVEARYLRAIHRFVVGESVPNLRAHDVEYWDEANEQLTALGLGDVFDGTVRPVEGEELSWPRFENAFKRCFREAAWMEFYWERRFLVHLGHDLRLTIATTGNVEEATIATRNDGLFVHTGNLDLPTLEAWRRIDAGW